MQRTVELRFTDKRLAEIAISLGETACRDGGLRVDQDDELFVAAPIFVRGSTPTAIVLCAEPEQSILAQHLASTAATHFTLARVLSETSELDETLHSSAAVLELLELIYQADAAEQATGEYSFVSRLDGSVTLDQALSATVSESPLACLTEADALTISAWLVDNRLAVVEAETVSGRSPPPTLVGRIKRGNPVAFRIPLLRPDRLFESIIPVTAWLFRLPTVIAWLVLLIYASWCISARWDQFWSTSSQVLSPSNWPWLVVCWIPLKVIHELGHGLACKRYGGVVRETGLFFILLAPLAYVDVTSSWLFRSKWQRIITAAGGMYLETMLAAVAALVWCRWPTGVIGQISFNTVMMAGVATIVFNANPLMRFDGYYVLSDWLGIPNLYSSGQQFVSYLGQRTVLGVPATKPLSSAILVNCYGVAALGWRVLVCVGLVVTASAMFQGAGVVLAVAAVAIWLGRPLWSLGEQLRVGRVDPTRFGLVAGSLILFLTAMWLWVPWCFATSAPARVSYAPLDVVRASSAGFVREVCVADGQQVRTGQLLLRLENRDLQLEVHDLVLQIEQSEILIRQNENGGDLAAAQAEKVRRASLQQRLEEQRNRVHDLIVVAPAPGRVFGPYLHTLKDTCVSEGSELLSIGDESRKEFELSIAQDDVHRFAAHRHQPVSIWLPGLGSLTCTLSTVDPQARRAVTEPSFAATEGGPVALQQADDGSGQQQYQFIEPRFSGTVAITGSQGRALRAGQFAVVSFAAFDETVGQHLYRIAADWIRERFAQAKEHQPTSSWSIE